MGEGTRMYLLIITLYATIGAPYEVTLKGDTPLYPTRQECEKAGEHVVNWLTQDFIHVKYECQEVPK